MIVGAMQPYFFPYAGHFSLIAAVDEWVVFDVTQYTPKRWINRNRVLHPERGWQYATVPLANSSIHIRTCEARIREVGTARTRILGKLSHYRRKAPHYARVVELVEQAFDSDDASLVHLNVRGLVAVCKYLGLPFRYRVCSEDPVFKLPVSLPAGEWALEIASALGASQYLNPVSGRALFDPAAFKKRGIALRFGTPQSLNYATGPFAFEPDLSILDLLMWVDAATAAKMIRGALEVGA